MIDTQVAKPSDAVIEILTLTLKPGTRAQFHQLYITEALPLLKKWNFRVLAYGPSRHDENSYYVIRSFNSLDERQQAEDAYYGSADWRAGPRAAILALIEHDAYFVISPDTVKGWLDALPK
jgi:hypothetical protein